jgi:hypothetical protein
VIGRYMVDKLLAEDHWQVVGLSRRPRRALPCRFQPGSGAASGYAANIAPNRDMLVNSVTVALPSLSSVSCW